MIIRVKTCKENIVKIQRQLNDDKNDTFFIKNQIIKDKKYITQFLELSDFLRILHSHVFQVWDYITGSFVRLASHSFLVKSSTSCIAQCLHLLEQTSFAMGLQNIPTVLDGIESWSGQAIALGYKHCRFAPLEEKLGKIESCRSESIAHQITKCKHQCLRNFLVPTKINN